MQRESGCCWAFPANGMGEGIQNLHNHPTLRCRVAVPCSPCHPWMGVSRDKISKSTPGCVVVSIGLSKKARELSVLCSCDVLLIINGTQYFPQPIENVPIKCESTQFSSKMWTGRRVCLPLPNDVQLLDVDDFVVADPFTPESGRKMELPCLERPPVGAARRCKVLGSAAKCPKLLQSGEDWFKVRRIPTKHAPHWRKRYACWDFRGLSRAYSGCSFVLVVNDKAHHQSTHNSQTHEYHEHGVHVKVTPRR